MGVMVIDEKVFATLLIVLVVAGIIFLIRTIFRFMEIPHTTHKVTAAEFAIVGIVNQEVPVPEVQRHDGQIRKLNATHFKLLFESIKGLVPFSTISNATKPPYCICAYHQTREKLDISKPL